MVFQAEKIVDEEGGHKSGAKDKMPPVGRLARAIDIPAI